MQPASAPAAWLYAGTYTTGSAQGIYRFSFATSSGALTPLGLAAAMPNPSFLAVPPDGRCLYAVSEGPRTGRASVHAFAIDRQTGALGFLNAQSSGGDGPCHLCLARTGRAVLVANYGAGSVARLPLAPDGSLCPATDVMQHHGASVHPTRQTGPHAHAAIPSPDGRFALVPDLGLDRILLYRLDPATGRLQPHDPPWVAVTPGAGPRHLAFHPTLPCAYLANELDNTLLVFAWDARRGTLDARQTVAALPPDFAGESSLAEVAPAPDGRFLYASNRGHDSLAVFRVQAETGLLAAAGHVPTLGHTPRHFTLHPSGAWLLAANQDTDAIVVFRRDADSGMLTPAGSAAVACPVCLCWVPAGAAKSGS
jgi:6-phosphogluconolactonase